MTTNNVRVEKTNFYCKICNYETVRKSQYDRHNKSNKHIKQIGGLQTSSASYTCDCGHEYSCRQNLYRHKLKCSKKFVDKNSSHYDQYTIMTLINQNAEFKNLIVQQNQTILELSRNNTQINNNTTNNNTTNNNNQKFNLNFFLNTTCKDALNMSEFIENMEIGFKDIENIGKNGYISGMTDMILSRIKELDVTKRPLHCTDLKRETMYIKDNDEWCKDTPDNNKLHKMVKYVAKRNYTTIPLWREKHPECQDWNNPQYDFCVDMMRNILGDFGDEQIRLDNKVIKNLSKHILVDKTG